MQRLEHCLEELLKFTLRSHIDGTLNFDFEISSQFCSNLLEVDPNDSVSQSTATLGVGFDESSLRGVPLYPLYKRLAVALGRSMNRGAFCRSYKKVTLMNEDSFLEQKEEEWSELILRKGRELIDILEAVEFELHVQEPFFSLIRDGQKTFEGRCTINDYNRLEPGSVILLNKCVMLKVQTVRHYASFSDISEAGERVKVLLGVETKEEGNAYVMSLATASSFFFSNKLAFPLELLKNKALVPW